MVAWVSINNYEVKFKLDTGVKVNLIPHKLFKNKKNKDNLILNCDPIIKTYGGFNVKPLGLVKFNCYHKNRKILLEFILVDDRSTSILGLEGSVKLNLIKKGRKNQ